jgi:hypothetical protein
MFQSNSWHAVDFGVERPQLLDTTSMLMFPSLGAFPNKISETLWQREDCNVTV